MPLSLGARFDPAMNARVWSLAWPMILSNVTVPLLGLVDTAVVGHLSSPIYLAAVAIGSTLFSVLFWGFGFLRMATTGHVAKAYGEKDHQQLMLLLGQGLLMSVALGILLLLLQTPLIHIGLNLLNPDPDVRTQAEIYAEIRILSAPAVLANYTLLGWFLGMQNSRVPLLLLVCANLINIILDILLVAVFNLQVAGVAWATLVADYSSLALGSYLAWRHIKQLDCRFDASALWQLARYKKLISSNRYLFIRTLMLLFVFSFFSRQGAQLGADTLAANAVLLNFLMLTSHGLDGFAHAIEALSGRYAGAKDSHALRQACWSAGLWSVVTALGFTMLFSLGGPWIITLLTDIESIRTLANTYLPWVMVLPVLAVWGYLFDGIFIGIHWFRSMQNLMLLCVFTIYLPCWWLTQSWGNHGLWLALCIFMLSRGLFALALLVFHKTKGRSSIFEL